jgi:hypothetical protein
MCCFVALLPADDLFTEGTPIMFWMAKWKIPTQLRSSWYPGLDTLCCLLLKQCSEGYCRAAASIRATQLDASYRTAKRHTVRDHNLLLL